MAGDVRPARALITAGWLAAVVVACADASPQTASAIVVDDAFTTEGSMAIAVYLDLSNAGGPDTIVGAELLGRHMSLAEDVSLHQTTDRDGLSIMEPTDRIEVGGETDEALAPGGAHIMLEGLSRPIVAGEVIPLRLDFERGADVDVEARALSADDAVGRLSGDEP